MALWTDLIVHVLFTAGEIVIAIVSNCVHVFVIINVIVVYGALAIVILFDYTLNVTINYGYIIILSFTSRLNKPTNIQMYFSAWSM